MIPVVSSTIRAAAYDSGRAVIVVQFLSGATYECKALRETFLEFMAAPSKGRFYRENLAGSAQRLIDCREPAKSVTYDATRHHGTHRSFEEDDCCKIVKASFNGELEGKREWTCPKCGITWMAEFVQTDSGGLKEHEHWRPRPVITVF